MALSLETGGLGGDWDTSRRLRLAAGEQAIRNSAWRQRREEAAAEDPNQGKPDPSVWRPGSGFRNTGAFRERALAERQPGAGAAEMGEPTSFRSGAGAPEPIAVMRGTTTTFSPGRLPGRQFAEPETATPLEARQVWNRGMRAEAVAAADRRGFTVPEATLEARYGSWREPGTSRLETIANLDPTGARAFNLARTKGVEEAIKTSETAQKQQDRRRAADQFLHEIVPTAGGTRAPNQNAPGYKLTWPTDPGKVADLNRAYDTFMATGDKAAARKVFDEHQALRRYLEAIPNKPENFNMEGFLNEAYQNPQAWQQLVALARNYKQAPPTPWRQRGAEILGEMGAGY
jgi:hypothetical protein